MNTLGLRNHAHSFLRATLHTSTSNPSALVAAALTSFLIIGISQLGFNITWLEAGLTLASAVASEYVLATLLRYRAPSVFSALAAGLGICLFFRSSIVLFFPLAGFLAIASKYLITNASRAHIFNPSNFAVLILSFLFPAAATIELTQWGTNPILFVVIALVCGAIVTRARMQSITISFFGSYALLSLALLPRLPEIYLAHFLGILSPSLVLFACFMITDPKTVPSGKYERILHGIAIAMLYYILEIAGIRYALFLASFLMAILNVLSRQAVRVATRAMPALTARNAASFALIALVAMPVFGAYIDEPPRFSPQRISLKFAALGVQTDRILRCSDTPALKAGHVGPFAHGSSTSGSAWGDVDGDGFDDLFISHEIGAPSALYHNNHNGTFTDITAQAGLPSIYSSSAYLVDYDNDGKLDLFLAYPSVHPKAVLSDTESGEVPTAPALAVYRNTGGHFVDVTRDVGLDKVRVRANTAAAMSFADYDGDGDLDFVLATNGSTYFNLQSHREPFSKNRVDPFFDQGIMVDCLGSTACSTHTNKIEFSRSGWTTGFSLGAPIYQQKYTPGTVHLFENRAGRFVEHADFRKMVDAMPQAAKNAEVREGAGETEAVSGRFFQPVSFDYDGDGMPDIFIATDSGRSVLLKNAGDLRFVDRTREAGLDRAASAMGAVVADYNGDGNLDVAVTNMLGDTLFLNRGNGAFSVSTSTFGTIGIGWGIASGDFNMDGHDDIYETNGQFIGTVNTPVPSFIMPLFRTDRLYLNDGAGGLADATWDDLCPGARSGRVVSLSDMNNDGTPDIFVGDSSLVGLGTTDRLYTNTWHGSYIKIRLRGTTDNSHGIGAEVVVSTPEGSHKKVVLAGSGFHGQDSSRLTFGLGSYAGPVRITVTWPSGRKSVIPSARSGGEITITE